MNTNQIKNNNAKILNELSIKYIHGDFNKGSFWVAHIGL